MTDRSLRIAVIDENPIQTAILIDLENPGRGAPLPWIAAQDCGSVNGLVLIGVGTAFAVASAVEAPCEPALASQG